MFCSQSFLVVKTDYDNFAFVTACYPLSESTTKQVVYVLVRSKKCWAEHNKDFIELELDKLSDLGFYTGNLEDVTQTGKGSADFLINCSNEWESFNDYSYHWRLIHIGKEYTQTQCKEGASDVNIH